MLPQLTLAPAGSILHHMLVRIRIPELLKSQKPEPWSPYRLSVASGGRISMSTAYRLNRNQGRVKTFDGELLETLCDVLKVEPGELLEREHQKRRGK